MPPYRHSERGLPTRLRGYYGDSLRAGPSAERIPSGLCVVATTETLIGTRSNDPGLLARAVYPLSLVSVRPFRSARSSQGRALGAAKRTLDGEDRSVESFEARERGSPARPHASYPLRTRKPHF